MHTSTNTAPSLVSSGNTISLTTPYQSTPSDVRAYLVKMEWTPMSSSGGDVWYRPQQSGYFTWEQAVAYTLVKPWLV
jgi:hypothetical protein